jgi:hypothetical protein
MSVFGDTYQARALGSVVRHGPLTSDVFVSERSALEAEYAKGLLQQSAFIISTFLILAFLFFYLYLKRVALVAGTTIFLFSLSFIATAKTLHITITISTLVVLMYGIASFVGMIFLLFYKSRDKSNQSAVHALKTKEYTMIYQAVLLAQFMIVLSSYVIAPWPLKYMAEVLFVLCLVEYVWFDLLIGFINNLVNSLKDI